MMTDNEYEFNYYWYCPNCGTISMGYQETMGKVRVECPRCHAVAVRRILGRRHVRFDIYSPYGEGYQTKDEYISDENKISGIATEWLR